MQWTVVAIATRGGADGEGVSPSPVSRYDPHTSPPTPPGLRPPPPPRGAGAVMAISKGKPCLNFVSDGSSSRVTKNVISGFCESKRTSPNNIPRKTEHDNHSAPVASPK